MAHFILLDLVSDKFLNLGIMSLVALLIVAYFDIFYDYT